MTQSGMGVDIGGGDRSALVARWLRDIGGYTASDATIQMLRRCPNKQTLQLVASILESPGWFVLDERHFANQEIQLSIRPVNTEPVIDLLLEHRKIEEKYAIEVVNDNTMPAQQQRQATKAKDLGTNGRAIYYAGR